MALLTRDELKQIRRFEAMDNADTNHKVLQVHLDRTALLGHIDSLVAIPKELYDALMAFQKWDYDAGGRLDEMLDKHCPIKRPEKITSLTDGVKLP